MEEDGTLALLRDLVAADEAHSALIAELDGLLRDTADVRAHAERVSAMLASAPARRDELAAALEQTQEQARERAAALAEAQRELAAAQGDRNRERLAAAERFVERAQDAVTIAGRRVAAAEEVAAKHEAEVGAARRQAPEVEGRAAAIAAALRGRARLAADAGRVAEPGLEGVVGWARAARAALTVARSGVTSEREAVIRQTNELGSALLGEPIEAASAALVERRVAARAGADAPPRAITGS